MSYDLRPGDTSLILGDVKPPNERFTHAKLSFRLNCRPSSGEAWIELLATEACISDDPNVVSMPLGEPQIAYLEQTLAKLRAEIAKRKASGEVTVFRVPGMDEIDDPIFGVPRREIIRRPLLDDDNE